MEPYIAGNKTSMVETVNGKKTETTFTYDDCDRLISQKTLDKETKYTYDKNGNRISKAEGDEVTSYVYDTENRLLAVKDKKGLLMSALYDGDDNRVFTASRSNKKTAYAVFKDKAGDKENPVVVVVFYSIGENIGGFFSSLTDGVYSQGQEDKPKYLKYEESKEESYKDKAAKVIIPYTNKDDLSQNFEVKTM